jgi:transposase
MERLTMSRKERERLVVFGQVKVRQLSRAEAAEVLGLSLRQVHRLYVRWRDEGDPGLSHRARGRASPRRWSASERDRALALYRERYRDFGPTLFAEKLAGEHGIWASHDTARRWLVGAGLHDERRRGAAGARGRGARARRGSARWCRWTAARTRGSRAAARRAC